MKNKFFVFGMLIALFALSLPLYADPGGTVSAVSVSAANLSIDAAMVETQAVTQSAVFDSIATTEAVKTVAGFAVLILGALLLAVAFMPFLFGLKRTAARHAESDIAKRTKSEVLFGRATA